MKFVVDPPELHRAAERINSIAQDYDQMYRSLMDTASTMGEAWNAADNLRFVEQIKGFCEELKAMTEHLQQAASALDQQATNYETVREGNIAGVAKLAN